MYLFLLSRRYLFSRPIMSAAITLAVMLSVFILIVVRSVFQGFGDQMKNMIKGTTAHLIIGSENPLNLAYARSIAEDIEALPGVVGTAPFVETMAMYQSQNMYGANTNFLKVKAIDPVKEASVGDFERYLMREDLLNKVLGSLFPQKVRIPRPKERQPYTTEEIQRLFSEAHRDKLWEARKKELLQYAPQKATSLNKKLPVPLVAGIQTIIAGRLRIGHMVQLTTYSPQKGEIKNGDFIVVGAFHSGLFEEDLNTVYIPLMAGCELVDSFDENLPDEDGFIMGGYRMSGVGVTLTDYDGEKARIGGSIGNDVLRKYALQMRKAAPTGPSFDATLKTWEESKRTLLQAVEIEKGIVTLIIFILVIFVGAIIFLILTLNVSEKRKDIGILKAIGSHYQGIMAIFLIYGAIICTIGMVLGFCSGLVFCHYINDVHDAIYNVTGWRLFPPDIYYLDRIPVSITLWDLGLIAGFTVLFSFLGSLLPAIVAARQSPIKAIHYE